MKIRNTFYREAGEGAGGSTRVSLASLVGDDANNSAGDTGGIEGGDGTAKIPVLNADGSAAPVEGVNTDGTIQDGYTKDETTGVVSKVTQTTEGVNDDGSLQEGYIKDAEGNVTKDPEYKAPDEGDEEDFLGTVEKLTGFKVEVEYPEGVDPVSPQGIALRDQELLNMGMQEMEKTIQEKDPRAYAYMLHRLAGKSDDEFFGNKQAGYTLPVKESLDTDADAQAAVYKYDLLTKGNSEDEATALVTIAIKNNTLATKATASYGTIESAQKKELEELQSTTAQLAEQEQNLGAALVRNIDTAIAKEISFIVPEAAKSGFKNYVLSNLRYQDGKHYVVQEISPETLKNQVEALLFQYKKGDLSNIIKKKAATVASQRLTTKVNQSNNGQRAGEGLGKSSKGTVALGSII